MSDPAPSEQSSNREGWWTRDHALVVVLVSATAVLLVLCWQLVRPFMAPLAGPSRWWSSPIHCTAGSRAGSSNPDLTLTDAILEIWRRRTARGRPAEAGRHGSSAGIDHASVLVD